MKTKARKVMGDLIGLIGKEKKTLQTLEAKMAAYLKDKGGMPTDDEIRELCILRARYKKENK